MDTFDYMQPASSQGDNGYLIRRPYGHTKADQDWTSWEKYHKQYDPWTKSWDIFPDPIPDTVLHYSQLLSPSSPGHPAPPPLPISPAGGDPYDFGPMDDDDIPLTFSPTPSEPHEVDFHATLTRYRLILCFIPHLQYITRHHQR